jgi:Uma2 family endonuclease
MNMALRKPMSLEEFLVWEDAQELRYEFDGWQPIAMTGGTAGHSFIRDNLVRSVGGRLIGRPCRYIGGDLKIEVIGRIRYPDGFVVCSPVPRNSKVVRDPVVIFEVLSPSTAGTDHGVKNGEYAATPSVRRYVMLEQDRIAATVFARTGDDWVGRLILGDVTLDLPEIGISLPLAELYGGVDFSEANEDSD